MAITNTDTLTNKKENIKDNEEEQLVDILEPKPTLKNQLKLFKEFGLTNWFIILIGWIASACVGAFPVVIYVIMAGVMDSLTPDPVTGKMPSGDVMKEKVNNLAMWFAIVAAISFLCNFISNFALNFASERIGMQLKRAYFNNLLEQEIGYFDMKQTGVLTAGLSEDISRIQDTYTMKLGNVFQYLVQTICGVVMAFTRSWSMSLVILSTSPLLILLVMVLGKVMEDLTKKSGKASEHSSGIATEVISAIRTVRSMSGEDFEKLRFFKDLSRLNFYGLFRSIGSGIMMSGIYFIIWGTAALAFWFGGSLVIKLPVPELSIGALIQVFGQMLMAVIGIGQAFGALPEIVKAKVSASNLIRVLHRKPDIPYKGGKTVPGGVKGNVKFENVVFSYPSRPNVTVLKDFSFEISIGQSVALVGPSGSGKSTIIGLVEKFYKPKSGNIYIDGINISELDPQWLHKNVGVVTQEPVLFATTIAENIAYAVGIENVTQQQIEEAAKAANAHNFIIDLPEGYQTRLGEKGVSMSGGQKQRIAIARAVLQDPQLLLLDEATSALDTESEALVQAALDKLMKGRTSICIAHRLTTIQNCDVILVLHRGVLKEVGKHEELLKIENGIYRKLAQKQMMFGSNDNGENLNGLPEVRTIEGVLDTLEMEEVI